MMFQVIVGIQKVFGTQGFGINYLVLTLNLRGERNRTSRHPGHSPPVRMEQAEAWNYYKREQMPEPYTLVGGKRPVWTREQIEAWKAGE